MAESLGKGTLFQRYDGTSWSTVAQVASVQPPQPEREVVNVDDLAPANDVQKKLLGLIDLGDVTLTLNFDDADAIHTALETDFYSATERQYRIRLPSGKGWTFLGRISQYAPQEIGANDVIQLQVTITVTEKPTFGIIS